MNAPRGLTAFAAAPAPWRAYRLMSKSCSAILFDSAKAASAARRSATWHRSASWAL